MAKERHHLPPVVLLLLILAAIVLAVVLIRWYDTPIPSGGTLEVYDDRGNTAVVRLDLTLSLQRMSILHHANAPLSGQCS